MFRIDSTEDFSRFSGRLFDCFSGKKVMYQDFVFSWYITLVFRLKSPFPVPMYHESADLWYITFEGRVFGE